MYRTLGERERERERSIRERGVHVLFRSLAATTRPAELLSYFYRDKKKQRAASGAPRGPGLPVPHVEEPLEHLVRVVPERGAR